MAAASGVVNSLTPMLRHTLIVGAEIRRVEAWTWQLARPALSITMAWSLKLRLMKDSESSSRLNQFFEHYPPFYVVSGNLLLRQLLRDRPHLLVNAKPLDIYVSASDPSSLASIAQQLSAPWF